MNSIKGNSFSKSKVTVTCGKENNKTNALIKDFSQNSKRNREAASGKRV